MKLRVGFYETDYGNTAVYRGGKTAIDLDSSERIPVALLAKWVAPLVSMRFAPKREEGESY
jgi:hypothetical protein